MLLNGDLCKIGDWALKESESAGAAPEVVRIAEIVKPVAADRNSLGFPDVVLLQTTTLSFAPNSYQMPGIKLEESWTLVPVTVGCFSLNHIGPY
jgi:hypothetical protein